jgi:hypothetical protein
VRCHQLFLNDELIKCQFEVVCSLFGAMYPECLTLLDNHKVSENDEKISEVKFEIDWNAVGGREAQLAIICSDASDDGVPLLNMHNSKGKPTSVKLKKESFPDAQFPPYATARVKKNGSEDCTVFRLSQKPASFVTVYLLKGQEFSLSEVLASSVKMCVERWRKFDADTYLRSHDLMNIRAYQELLGYHFRQWNGLLPPEIDILKLITVNDTLEEIAKSPRIFQEKLTEHCGNILGDLVISVILSYCGEGKFGIQIEELKMLLNKRTDLEAPSSEFGLTFVHEARDDIGWSIARSSYLTLTLFCDSTCTLEKVHSSSGGNWEQHIVDVYEGDFHRSMEKGGLEITLIHLWSGEASVGKKSYGSAYSYRIPHPAEEAYKLRIRGVLDFESAQFSTVDMHSGDFNKGEEKLEWRFQNIFHRKLEQVFNKPTSEEYSKYDLRPYVHLVQFVEKLLNSS